MNMIIIYFGAMMTIITVRVWKSHWKLMKMRKKYVK
jgi:hypothetical protein